MKSLVSQLRFHFLGIIRSKPLYILLFLECFFVGFSYIQAIDLYREASLAAQESPGLASGLSPFDGFLVPLFGAHSVLISILFPFLTIRQIAVEYERGSYKILDQISSRGLPQIMSAFVVSLFAWVLSLIPILIAIAHWLTGSGHISFSEVAVLLIGHGAFALTIISISLLVAHIMRQTSPAVIIVLSMILGFWMIESFAGSVPSELGNIAKSLSFTANLKAFERGILSMAHLLYFVGLVGLFLGLSKSSSKVFLSSRRIAAIIASAVLGSLVLSQAIQELPTSYDFTENRRNSFSPAIEQAFSQAKNPVHLQIYLSPDDSRLYDFERDFLGRLKRSLRHLTVEYAYTSRSGFKSSSDDLYGIFRLSNSSRSAQTRSTNEEELLPIVFDLIGISQPQTEESFYPGHPLIAASNGLGILFYIILPFIIVGIYFFITQKRRLKYEIHFNIRLNHRNKLFFCYNCNKR